MDNLQKNKLTMKILGAINTVLIVVCFIGDIFGIISTRSVYYITTASIELLAIALSLSYLLNDYKKDGAKYYRLFMYFYAGTYLVEILFSSIFETSTAGDKFLPFGFLSFILYGNTLILAVGKDIGKKASLIICTINATIYLVAFIVCCFISVSEFVDLQEKLAYVSIFLTWLTLSLIAFVMTLAKYTDKAIRKQE